MTSARAVALIATREAAARAKGFLLSSAALLTVSLAGMAALIAVSDDPSRRASLQGSEADTLVAFIGVVVLFVAILAYGQVILMSVAEEKSTQVVEVVLGVVSPPVLLVGKVLAIGLLGLAQLAGVGLIVVATGTLSGAVELPNATIPALLTTTAWFVLGYSFYVCAFAAAGALVGRHQNAANAAGPVNMVLMVGYFVGVFSVQSESDNLVMRIASLLPVWSPVTLPSRIVQGDAVWWEVALSLTLMAAGIWLLIRLAGRVYVGALRRGGGKLRIREAWRAATH